MSEAEDLKAQEEKLKEMYGGILPAAPLMQKGSGERAYFDSADWAKAKESGGAPAKAKGPLAALQGKPKSRVESLKPKLEPTPQGRPNRRSSLTAVGNPPADAGAEPLPDAES